ncbi:MAG: hypothetical protein V3V20_01560 [Algisphaera sp.]
MSVSMKEYSAVGVIACGETHGVLKRRTSYKVLSLSFPISERSRVSDLGVKQEDGAAVWFDSVDIDFLRSSPNMRWREFEDGSKLNEFPCKISSEEAEGVFLKNPPIQIKRESSYVINAYGYSYCFLFMKAL